MTKVKEKTANFVQTQLNCKKGRPKTFNKAQASEIAMKVYLKNGMNNISLNEMCRQIGVSKPSVYREFGGEEGLKVSALNLYLESSYFHILTSHLFGNKGLVKNLQSAFDYLINNKEKAGSYPCMYNQESWFPSSSMTLSCKKLIKEKDKEIYDNLKNMILEAIENKEISIDSDVDIYAKYIQNQLRLIVTLSNNDISKNELNGIVNLIMKPLK